MVVPDFEYLKQEKIANSQTIIKFDLDNLGRELPEYQRVREYIVRAEPLPRTATRKIKRFELQKAIKAGTLGEGDAPPEKIWTLTDEDRALLSTNIGQAVTEVIKRNSRDAAVIHPQMNLEIDLGLDSLSRAEVFAALEQALATEFEAEEAAQALTVADVVKLAGDRSGAIGENETISTDLNWAMIVRQADEDLPEVRPVLKERPIFIRFAYGVYKCFNVFCRGFMQLEVHGKENLEKLERPFLICPNHQSFLDPFVLCSNYSFDKFKNTFHVGASQFFENSFMKWVAAILQTVPVDPDTQLMKAMKAGAAGLKHGRIMNIYPEGERAFDGELHEFKKGAAILAAELELPILPVALDGLHKVWPRGTWRIRPAKVKIRFGRPFYAKDVVGDRNDPRRRAMSDEQVYSAVIDHLKTEIAGMIAEMRGEKS
jgi:long-chain acyl-CoA synthetase